MDTTTQTMLVEAYEETVSEALVQGRDLDIAHKEGIVAAAMFLSAMVGLEDAAARAEVEKLGLRPN